MNGAGNDFVLLDNRAGKMSLTREQVVRLCDRHRGIGADGVLIGGCHPGDCHYISGNEKAYARMEKLKVLLKKIGIEEERFRIHQVSASEGKQFSEIITNFTMDIKKLGESKIPKKTTESKIQTSKIEG